MCEAKLASNRRKKPLFLASHSKEKMKSSCNSVIYHSLIETKEENKRNIKVGRGKAAAEVSTPNLKGKTGKIIKVVRTKNL